MNYQPRTFKKIIQNPAGSYSRIFVYTNVTEKRILNNSHIMYFAADFETSATDETQKDQQVIGFSLAPKMAEQSFAICSTVYTNQKTTITELFNTIDILGSKGNGVFIYFHNLDYDGYFILNYLEKICGFEYTENRISADNAKSAEFEKKYSILYNCSSLIEIKVVWNKKCFIFRNSFKLWNAGIPEISNELVKINENDIKKGEFPSFPFVFKKEELNFDYAKIRKFGEIISDDEIKYMLNDVNTGVSILKMFEPFGALGVSASGMAYNLCIKSFQEGILTPDLIKFMLKNHVKLINDKNELSKFIKCVVHENETFIFTKSFQTNDFNNLNENSIEYITKIQTIYHSINSTQKAPTTDIATINKKCDLTKIIIESLKDENITEFSIYKEVMKNPVFSEFYKDTLNFEIGIAVYDFLNLKMEKQLQNNSKIPVKNTEYRIIKSFEYYFNKVFPPLTYEEDTELRQAYKGGLTSAVELYSNSEQHNIISIDINSSYPFQMSNQLLPYGKPRKFKIKKDKSFDPFREKENIYIDENNNTYTIEQITEEYQLYIFKFHADFELQYPFCPMVPDKYVFNDTKFKYSDTKERQIEYDEWLFMTNVEFETFCKTHNVNIDDVYIDTIWTFNSYQNIFENFVNKLFRIKDSQKGTSFYYPVKLLMNSLYGRFSMNKFNFVEKAIKVNIDENDILRIEESKKTDETTQQKVKKTQGLYLPVAIFTTAYARTQLIKAANKINLLGGFVCYYDTDSLHFHADKTEIINNKLFINEKDADIFIGNNIGEWKLEVYKYINDDSQIVGIETGIYICSKRYIETDDNFKNIKCAGIPKTAQKDLTLQQMQGGKITVKNRKKAKSGIILKDVVKHLELNLNAYKTKYGTVLHDRIFKIGDEINDMYGRSAKIEKIIYLCSRNSINFDVIINERG